VKVTASVLQLAGLALIALMAGLIFPPAGFIVFGLELALVGLALESR
jgi:hypothetical protein